MVARKLKTVEHGDFHSGVHVFLELDVLAVSTRHFAALLNCAEPSAQPRVAGYGGHIVYAVLSFYFKTALAVVNSYLQIGRVYAVGRYVFLSPAAILGLAFEHEEVGLRTLGAHHVAVQLVNEGDGFQLASVPKEHALDAAVANAERVSLHGSIALRPRLARTQSDD